MYEQFYGLEKPPFNITPDPDFLYLGPGHREALASIMYGVEQRKGFIVLVGEVGVGKTTLLRSYVAKLDATRVTVAYVFNTKVTFKQLLDTICRDLGVSHPPEADEYELVSWLQQFLVREYQHSRNVVLVVDEAHGVPLETLESLRVLSNLEGERDKLLQIVLAGQPEFAATLEKHALRQLSQRIAVRYTLVPLSAQESREYIESRLNRVGGTTAEVFDQKALKRIVEHAAGIPRMLNILCDNAMAAGMGYQAKPVTPAIVNEVIADLEGRPKPRRRRAWRTAAVALAAVVLAAGALVLGWPHRDLLSPKRPAAAERTAARSTPAAPAPAAKAPAAKAPAAPAPAAPAPATGARGAARAAPPPADTTLWPGGWPAPSDAPAMRPQGAGKQAAQPATQDDRRFVRAAEVTRVVNVGDTLNVMAEQVYGFVNEDVVQRILRSNPDIKNPDTILLGSVIKFPDVSDLRPGDVAQKRVR